MLENKIHLVETFATACFFSITLGCTSPRESLQIGHYFEATKGSLERLTKKHDEKQFNIFTTSLPLAVYKIDSAIYSLSHPVVPKKWYRLIREVDKIITLDSLIHSCKFNSIGNEAHLLNEVKSSVAQVFYQIANPEIGPATAREKFQAQEALYYYFKLLGNSDYRRRSGRIALEELNNTGSVFDFRKIEDPLIKSLSRNHISIDLNKSDSSSRHILRIAFNGSKIDSSLFIQVPFGSATIFASASSTVNSVNNSPLERYQPGAKYRFYYVLTIKSMATIYLIDSKSGETIFTEDAEGSGQWRSETYDFTSNYKNSSNQIINPWRYKKGQFGLDESDYLINRNHHKYLYERSYRDLGYKIAEKLISKNKL